MLDILKSLIQGLAVFIAPLFSYLAGRSAGKNAEKVKDLERQNEEHEKTHAVFVDEIDRLGSGPRTDDDVNGVFGRWKDKNNRN
jgi:hypothetical protein